MRFVGNGIGPETTAPVLLTVLIIFSGPIPLPTKRTVYTVLRSPHVDKKSREQFETRAHKRIIDIHNSNSKTIDSLSKLDIPAGVDIEIKL